MQLLYGRMDQTMIRDHIFNLSVFVFSPLNFPKQLIDS